MTSLAEGEGNGGAEGKRIVEVEARSAKAASAKEVENHDNDLGAHQAGHTHEHMFAVAHQLRHGTGLIIAAAIMPMRQSEVSALAFHSLLSTADPPPLPHTFPHRRRTTSGRCWRRRRKNARWPR